MPDIPLQRCELCSSTEPGPPGTTTCPACDEKYALTSCAGCGVRITHLRERGPAPSACTNCIAGERILSLPRNLLADVDACIFDRRIMTGVDLLSDSLGISTDEAIALYGARYRTLRALQPARFRHSDETYWENFHL